MAVEIEFNNGFFTALFLFYAHKNQASPPDMNMDIRIYGASDHLLDMDIPGELPDKLKERVEEFREQVLENRLSLKLKRKRGESFFNACRMIILDLGEKYNMEGKFEDILDEIDITGEGLLPKTVKDEVKLIDKRIFNLDVVIKYG